jgi:two-component system, sensor histidine kinase and response regulator
MSTLDSTNAGFVPDPEAAGRRNTPAVRVLLVEDNAVNQKIAIAMLERLGCAVDAATDGRQALDAQARAAYDLIFMDCQMPVMDGFAATLAIRERETQFCADGERSRRVPIVAMTGLEGDQERCLAHGMDDYLAKPFRQQQLQLMLERWVPGRLCAG